MYYTSQLIDGWISSEYNTYQYLKIDLEGLWEINIIAIKDSNWWNSNTFRYIMTTLSLKKQQNNASVFHLNTFGCLIFLVIRIGPFLRCHSRQVTKPLSYMNRYVGSKWYYTIIKVLIRKSLFSDMSKKKSSVQVGVHPARLPPMQNKRIGVTGLAIA